LDGPGDEATGNHIQDKYNFILHDMTASTFPEMVRRIFKQQTTAFKINLSFGFILRNVETGELRKSWTSTTPRCTAKQRKKQRLSV
jgi:hypothetical protein